MRLGILQWIIPVWILLTCVLHVHGIYRPPSTLSDPVVTPSNANDEEADDGEVISEFPEASWTQSNAEGIGFTEWQISRPCFVDMGILRRDSFFRIPNNTLVHMIQPKGSGMRWENLGGLSTSDIHCVSWNHSHIFVYQLALNQVVMGKIWTGRRWTEWMKLPMGMMREPPSCVVVAPGSIQCLGRSVDNHPVSAVLLNRRWRRKHVGKRKLTHPINCISASRRRADCFGTSADNKLQHVVWKRFRGWLPWESLGGAVNGTVSPVSTSVGLMDIFVKSSMERVSTISWDGSTWSKWKLFGMWGPMLAMDVECVESTEGRIDCFTAFLPRKRLHRISWNGKRWSKWMTYGYAIHDKPICRYVSEGRILCYLLKSPPKWTLTSFRLLRIPEEVTVT